MPRFGARSPKAGWVRAPGWSVAQLSAFLGADGVDPPVLPKLHLGRPAEDVLIRPSEGSARLVLRLWRSRYRVGGDELLLGAFEAERLERQLGFLVMPDDRPIAREDERQIADALSPLRNEARAALRLHPGNRAG